MKRVLLSEKDKKLLFEILLKNNMPYYKQLYENNLNFKTNEIKEIIGVLSDEFCRNGLKENDEPNSFGLEIENLIDIVNSWH